MEYPAWGAEGPYGFADLGEIRFYLKHQSAVETICVGQKLTIMLTDETYEEHEISSMRKWELKHGAKRGKWLDVDSISDGQFCEADVFGIKGMFRQQVCLHRQKEDVWLP